jgi:transposase InsO family protein
VTADEKMSIEERRQYLKRMQPRYAAADRQEKTRLIDEMEKYTGMHRVSIKRLINGNLERKRRNQERGKAYRSEFDSALALIWEATDYVCAERLTPNLVSVAEMLEKHQKLYLTPTLRQQLTQVSIATVRRHLPRMPQAHRRRKPQPPLNQYQKQIPTRVIPRNIETPGHFEMDLVHHCGPQATGEYVYTLQLMDVATSWSGRRAILERSYLVVADALVTLFEQIPFDVRELHPDNGSEFLNHHLLTFLRTHYPRLSLSRSRPSFPNDNRLVEQKNYTLVRQYLGDHRLDTVTQTRFLNTIYAKLDDLYNFIQPVMRQIDKHWVHETHSRPGYLKRIHDQPRSPWQRLAETQYISDEHRATCSQRFASLNPLQLCRDIHRALQHLFAYPGAQPDVVEDVYQSITNLHLFPEVIAALDLQEQSSDLSHVKEVAGSR